MFCRRSAWRQALVLVTAVLLSTPVWASIIYVDDDADPNGDGLTWGTAYDDLQDALSTAQSDPNITEIHVADGTYIPSAQTDPNDVRTATFSLLSGVALYGGYAGLADPNAPDFVTWDFTRRC